MAGAMRFNLTCPRCGGNGRLRNACPTCHGDGRIITAGTVEVRIPAGVAERIAPARCRERQCRHAGRPPGDLYITVRVEPHPFFERDGDNIEIKVPVTVTEAGLGAKIEVPDHRRARALLKIPQGTKNGQKFRLREKGVYNARKNSRGDQIVEVVLQAPHVTRRANEGTLRELAQSAEVEDPARRNLGKGVVGVDYMAKGRSKAAYMISAVAEQYQIHPQTLRLYEREGLLRPSRSDGNTRLYTDEDLERLEVILKLTRDWSESRGRRDHPQHAREDGGDAEAGGRVCPDTESEFASHLHMPEESPHIIRWSHWSAFLPAERKRIVASRGNGRNGQIRTADLPLRRRPLYPSELRSHDSTLPFNPSR